MRDAQVRRCAVTSTVLVGTPSAERAPGVVQGSSIAGQARSPSDPALSLRNVGNGPATYHVINWTSAATPAKQ
jgi:hypothetical protein